MQVEVCSGIFMSFWWLCKLVDMCHFRGYADWDVFHGVVVTMRIMDYDHCMLGLLLCIVG